MRFKLPFLLSICALAALLTAGLAGCVSVSKATIEARLLDLPKNAPVRDFGISTRTAEVVLDGEAQAVEFSFLHVPGPDQPVAAVKTLVLVHGTPSSLFTWSDLIFGSAEFAGLSRDFEIYALDVIGHGITRSEVSPCSFAKCAEYVAAFLDVMDLADVCLVGQSYGGEFAWRATLLEPGRIARLVLIDSSGYPREADGFLSEEVAMREMWLAPFGYLLNARDSVAAALAPHFGAPVPAERVEEIFQVCENAGNWRAMVDLARDENGLAAARSAEIRTPTLLIWGDRDLAYAAERDGRRFAAELPDARLRVIEDCGHYPHEERPAVVAEWLREFLAR